MAGNKVGVGLSVAELVGAHSEADPQKLTEPVLVGLIPPHTKTAKLHPLTITTYLHQFVEPQRCSRDERQTGGRAIEVWSWS